MKSLLFICHRIPYPPNKGDKIRSYNILKYLSKHYRVHLGAFVDDPDDFRYEHVVSEMCASYRLLPLNPSLGKIKSLSGIIKGLPLSLPYYADRKMQQWVDKVVADNELAGVLVFSSTMAQYIADERFSHLKRYMDFIDIDSDKWAQYQQHASPIMKLVYRYEAQMLFSWEKRVANEFDRSFFVSEKEAELFRKMVPGVSEKISYFNNGVDTEYYSPGNSYESPYQDSFRAIVFTGAMDYWANIDAVVWFSKHVLPAVCEKVSDLKFYIVGAKPDEKVKALAASPHIVVTGSVDDVRPYLAYAAVAVAPMRIARGIQNKVLEAMAMALPTVTTSQGYEGIDAVRGQELLVVDDVSDWVDTLINIVTKDQHNPIGQAARRLVVENYSWQGSLARLKQCIDSVGMDD